MLSLFPTLLSYQQLSPFLIRLLLGVIFIFWAYQTLWRKNTSLFNSATNSKTQKIIIGAIEAIVGLALVVGLWTQLAAAIIILDLLIRLIGRIQKRAFLTDGVNYYLVLLVLALSILVTGPGWWAFDMPL